MSNAGIVAEVEAHNFPTGTALLRYSFTIREVNMGWVMQTSASVPEAVISNVPAGTWVASVAAISAIGNPLEAAAESAPFVVPDAGVDILIPVAVNVIVS